MRAALVSFIVALAIAAPAAAETLSLACEGTGTYPEMTQGSATVNNARVTTNSTRVQNINAAVRFEMTDTGARIFMPPAMTPPMNSGSDGGWWHLDRIEATPEAIHGRFSLNLFNKPTVTIDRMAGTIEVDGNFRYHFLGQCERVETSAAPRF
jgi:hypothetical protein